MGVYVVRVSGEPCRVTVERRSRHLGRCWHGWRAPRRSVGPNGRRRHCRLDSGCKSPCGREERLGRLRRRIAKCVGSSTSVRQAELRHSPSHDSPVCQPPCSGQNSKTRFSGAFSSSGSSRSVYGQPASRAGGRRRTAPPSDWLVVGELEGPRHGGVGPHLSRHHATNANELVAEIHDRMPAMSRTCF
jgi:hypothetical protein